jgi:hypothetical protein
MPPQRIRRQPSGTSKIPKREKEQTSPLSLIPVTINNKIIARVKNKISKTYRPQTPKLGTTQNKLHSIKQITFPTSIPPHDTIHFWGKGMDFGLLLEGAEVG